MSRTKDWKPLFLPEPFKSMLGRTEPAQYIVRFALLQHRVGGLS
jgi:hypothetical protein